ncbi:FKBP-type peptidyl-prolyl cis-trans isomerase [Lutibacter sp.]|uniref:FKBP-type peptidyl-prolyl cis-trans isomerase n=1 Tax=Lutibacter sp. TaxID=1925666 RepID=UPI00356228D2
MKIKQLLFIAILGFIAFGCRKDDNDNFDAEAQAEIDDASLIAYLQSHYLNDDGAIWTITNGETPLMDQVQKMDITENDIEYKLYYLTLNEGTTNAPKRSDSIFTKYYGMMLDSTIFDTSTSKVWFSLTSLIDGWSYGFTKFKGGSKIINIDESFYYENYGEGFLFIPSGLGYGNVEQNIIKANSPLVFKIELHDINYADHDNDGILSSNEDRNNDGNVKNDDTDGDGIADYLDVDDDGDGILTKNESLTEDTDGDGIPNYLDKDN